MPKRKRRRFTSEFKARVALGALKEDRTIAQLASQYAVHPNQISQWKRQLKEQAVTAFSDSARRADEEAVEKEKARLFEEIGRLKVEGDFLRKKLGPIL